MLDLKLVFISFEAQCATCCSRELADLAGEARTNHKIIQILYFRLLNGRV